MLDFTTVDSLTQIFDMDGLNFSSRDEANKQIVTKTGKVFEYHYPETMVLQYFSVVADL